MTDEEKAEEYADSFWGASPSTQRAIKQAYLAGLKAGIQEKWHDLRKNPDDLPESSIFHEVLNQNGIKMYYDDVLKKWNRYYNGIIVQAQIPIAWCEIPKFKE